MAVDTVVRHPGCPAHRRGVATLVALVAPPRAVRGHENRLPRTPWPRVAAPTFLAALCAVLLAPAADAQFIGSPAPAALRVTKGVAKAGPSAVSAVRTALDGDTTGICARTRQVREAIVARIDGISDCADVTNAHLTGITGELKLNSSEITSLSAGDFAGLSSVRTLNLYDNDLTTLPSGLLAGMSNLQVLYLDNNDLTALLSDLLVPVRDLVELWVRNNELTELPAGFFAGVSSPGFNDLHLYNNPGDPDLRHLSVCWTRTHCAGGAPIPIEFSLQALGQGRFKVVVPVGTPFDLKVALDVTNGTIASDTITIPVGRVQSDTLTVTRAAGTTAAVIVDIVDLRATDVDPRRLRTRGGQEHVLPLYHAGIALVKAADLPVEVLPSVDDDEAPVVTGSTSFTVTEGETAVGTLSATDEDTAAEDLAWSLAGGTDESQFALTAAGVLSFDSAKDYENPDDSGSDGTYDVTVEVSDGTSSDTADVTVTLANRNEAPAADAGSDQTDIEGGATVTLGGSGSDPDADETLSYAWSQTAGTTVTLASPSSVETTFSAPSDLTADETLTFRLRVTDSGGLFDEDDTDVTVLAAPFDPDGTREGATRLPARPRRTVHRLVTDSLERAAGDSIDYYVFTLDERQVLGLGVRDQTIDLDATLEDASGNALIKSWPPPADATVEWLKTTLDTGTYYIRVEAVEDGATAYRIRFGLEDPPPPAAPEVTGSTSFTVTEGDTAVGTLSATDEDTAAEDLAWSLAGGTDESQFALTAAGVLSFDSAKDYENPDDNGTDGTYDITVAVSDGTSSDTADVTVTLANRNEAPSANAGSDQTDIEGGATVTLSGSGSDPDADETLTYAWSQTAGTSVTLASASSAEATFSAPSDLAADETLTFRLRVTDAGGLFAEDETNVTVLAVVAAPKLTVDYAEVDEGDTGTRNLTFTVTLSPASDTIVKVEVNTGPAPGDITARTDFSRPGGPDYQPVTGLTLTFGPGETEKTVDVLVNGDRVDELDAERLMLHLSNAVNADIQTESAIGYILDDDPPPQLTIENRVITEGDAGTRTMTFTAKASPPSGQEIIYYVDVVGGTATEGEDYRVVKSTNQVEASLCPRADHVQGASTAAMGNDDLQRPQQQIISGKRCQTQKTFKVLIIGDSVEEDDETFQIALTKPKNVILPSSPVTGTIVDDDATAAPPGAVRNLVATANGQTRIDVSWDAPSSHGGSAVTGYRVEVSDGGTTGWSDLAASHGRTSYAHTGLGPGTTKHYRISALNSVGAGPTQTASATTETAAPEVTGSTSFTVTEGDTAVGTLSATDEDTAAEDLAWSLAGGTDESQFELTAAGALSFDSAKDYENPDDNGTDGTYDVTVAVSDGTSSDTADVTVTLANRNEAPSVDAGSDQTDIEGGATVTLSGSGSDPDADETITYAWNQTAGTSVTLASASSAEATFSAPSDLAADEMLTFRLRVTDAGGLFAEDETNVTVLAAPAVLGAPTDFQAEAGNEQVTLTWRAPEYDGEITGYEYRFCRVITPTDCRYQQAAPTASESGWYPTESSTRQTVKYWYWKIGRQTHGFRLANGISYRFQVRAVAGDILGEPTAEVEATPKAANQSSDASSASDSDGEDESGGDNSEALLFLEDVTPEAAAAALFGDMELGEARLEALDRLGNRNGRYDLGDLLAWRARCRRGEARCGRASVPDGAVLPGAIMAPGAAAGQRWRTRRRKTARGRAGRCPPRFRSASSWLRILVLALIAGAWACGLGDDPVQPQSADAPAELQPGRLLVTLEAPSGARAAGAMILIEGPAVDSLRAPGRELIQADESSPTGTAAIVAGALGSGPVLEVWVPHVGAHGHYRARLLQVAREDYTLRDPREYAVVISR